MCLCLYDLSMYPCICVSVYIRRGNTSVKRRREDMKKEHTKQIGAPTIAFSASHAGRALGNVTHIAIGDPTAMNRSAQTGTDGIFSKTRISLSQVRRTTIALPIAVAPRGIFFLAFRASLKLKYVCVYVSMTYLCIHVSVYLFT